MSDADDIKKQVEEQDDEVYGEDQAGGHAPIPGETMVNTEDAVEKFTGNDIPRELNIAKQIEQDEDALQSQPFQGDNLETEDETE